MGDAEAHCREVIERLYLLVDDQLGDEERVLLERHVQACLHCNGMVTFEKELRVVISRKCKEGTVPTGLEDRLRSALRDLL